MIGGAVPGTLRKTALAKLGVATCGALLLLAACAPAGQPSTVKIESGSTLVTSVPDSLNDTGRDPSAALGPDGTPEVAYLLLQQRPAPGVLPVPVIAGAPQPPAVLLASQDKGLWGRVSVTKQQTTPTAKGIAPGISDSNGYAIPGVDTSLAVDAQGKYHVAWSGPGGVYYATDAAGSTGEPVQITDQVASGVSVAVTSTGTPWIAYYQNDAVLAATGGGSKFTTQTVAAVSPGGLLPARTSVKVNANGIPLIAYTNPGTQTPMLARQATPSVSGSPGSSGSTPSPGPSPAPGTGWTTETIEANGGGFAISLALDKDGNPHVAYYLNGTTQIEIHHAESMSAGSWQTEKVASFAAGSKQDVQGWATGIAVDDNDVHYLTWADSAANQVRFALKRGAGFVPQIVPSGFHGSHPSLAVSADGKSIALAWYDTLNANLDVATQASEGRGLAFSPTPAPSTTSAPPPAKCNPSGTALSISASGIAFSTDCLAAPAGQAFTLAFDNKDAGVPHNVDIYTDSSGTTHLGGAKDATDTIIGPAQTTYSVTALKAGSYYFRCDIHPTVMFGTFVVK
jgi:plastocyanin